MAIRSLRLEGDPILRKRSREVTEINDRILELLKDMAQTMVKENGIGLAAPQVGVLRRVVTIDIGFGLLNIINPEIIETEGEQIDVEGCLSIPGFNATVARPLKIKVKFLNEKGEEVVMDCEGLLARAFCHEIDHLDGILFRDKYIEEYVYKDDKDDGNEAKI